MAALAALDLAHGETEHAITLLASAGTVSEFIHIPFLPYDHQQYERNLSTVREQIDSKIFHAAWEKGRALPFEQALEYALETDAMTVQP